MTTVNAIKTIVDYFCEETRNYMKDEDRIKSIRLNINFINRHPDLFQFVMRGPTDIFFGHTVRAKTRALKTEYNLGFASDEVQERLKTFNPNEAFDEIAAEWRLSIAQGNTILPYVPVESFVTVAPDSFSPKIGFKTRYGTIEATRDSEPFAT